VALILGLPLQLYKYVDQLSVLNAQKVQPKD